MQFSNRPHSDAAVLTENKPAASEVRKKRHRTTFSPSQLHVLEEAFARQQYLVGTERVRLAALLNIGVAQVNREIAAHAGFEPAFHAYPGSMMVYDCSV
ncbi:unnamed protein product [Nippostrongylus brasiliensis]|uniref:Homeobox domain-containing protein n=1 Tax=Nippostrongylus brasiliensis TaxID=27835 RepID=A0A0N4Y479_NIPBR|nr:unnamed protein product [Nippostrongylus brasiliensis]